MSAIWRPITSDDVPVLIELQNTANMRDNRWRSVNAEEIIRKTRSNEPAQNTRLISTSEGEPIAYGALQDPSAGPHAYSIEATSVVHPDWRRQGIGTELLNWQLARAAQIFRSQKSSVPKWLEVTISGTAPERSEFFAQHGFTRKRTWLEMIRPLAAPLPELNADIEITTPEDFSEETRRAYNDSFRDHWGTAPDSPTDWQRREQRSDYRPDLSFISHGTRADGTKEVTGLLTTQVDPVHFATRGAKFAYIHLFGVRRDWRGHGIAKALLARALHEFQAAGFERAELTVDAESLTGAVGVYEAVGFEEFHRHYTYAYEFDI